MQAPLFPRPDQVHLEQDWRQRPSSAAAARQHVRPHVMIANCQHDAARPATSGTGVRSQHLTARHLYLLPLLQCTC